MKKLIIAVDGYAGCGKSSTAKAVAEKLGYTYIDTGAMYRAVTLYFITNRINIADADRVKDALNDIEISFHRENDKQTVYLNGKNVEDSIRDIKVSSKVSEVSALSAVRKKMVSQQRKLGQDKGVVMDGRDIGTVVFPDAELKLFMTASDETRATRRLAELKEKNVTSNFNEVLHNLKTRDDIDTTRADSPLVKAPEAITIDTTKTTMDEQVDLVMKLIASKLNPLN